MKRFQVRLTDDAVKDLEELHEFLSRQDSATAAAHVVDRIAKAFDQLESLPERGSFPKELVNLGIKDYREAYFKPYRILYRVLQDTVYAYLIADGRRDMQTLLTRRLLRGD